MIMDSTLVLSTLVGNSYHIRRAGGFQISAHVEGQEDPPHIRAFQQRGYIPHEILTYSLLGVLFLIHL